jgi:hypothetical protein
MAKQQFGDVVKAVVDVEQGMMAIGGELHLDEEVMLLGQGSGQKKLCKMLDRMSVCSDNKETKHAKHISRRDSQHCSSIRLCWSFPWKWRRL